MHDPANLDTILTIAAVFMLAWVAFAFFGGVWLIGRYLFPAMDRVHDKLTSRKASNV